MNSTLVDGTPNDDTLVGDVNRNELNGGGGDDRIYGLGGSDTLFGGSGDDLFRSFGNDGIDTMYGGDGRDTISYVEALEGATIRLDNQQFLNSGAALGDLLFGIEDVLGTVHDDIIVGHSIGNRVFADEGDDTVYGQGGNDTLFGWSGNDLRRPPKAENNNHHYVVMEIDADIFGLDRDALVALLTAEGVWARRYFYPGGHRSPPHSENAYAADLSDVAEICRLVRFIATYAQAIRGALSLAQE